MAPVYPTTGYVLPLPGRMKLADQASSMHCRPVDTLAIEHYNTAILIAGGRLSRARLGAAVPHERHPQQQHPLFKAGADVGGDSIDDRPVAEKLLRLLDAQDIKGQLPKTILYSLNPTADYILATAAGTFQGDTPGKVQFGSAWWFNDHLDGMMNQMKALAAAGALGTFVGMLTDSRSFVSYTRHEYFRRIVCDLIGSWVEKGEYPNDEEALATLVRGICYDNANAYFDF